MLKMLHCVCVCVFMCAVNLQDIHLKKPYKSSMIKEQQVISRSTVPRAILEIYSKCDTPPALDKLNVFRSV